MVEMIGSSDGDSVGVFLAVGKLEVRTREEILNSKVGRGGRSIPRIAI